MCTTVYTSIRLAILTKGRPSPPPTHIFIDPLLIPPILTIQEAAENAIKRMKDCVHGHGGVIAIDQHGNFGKAFSTTRAVWASKKDNTLQSGMRLNEVETVG